jgi:hypothetical protein
MGQGCGNGHPEYCGVRHLDFHYRQFGSTGRRRAQSGDNAIGAEKYNKLATNWHRTSYIEHKLVERMPCSCFNMVAGIRRPVEIS